MNYKIIYSGKGESTHKTVDVVVVTVILTVCYLIIICIACVVFRRYVILCISALGSNYNDNVYSEGIFHLHTSNSHPPASHPITDAVLISVAPIHRFLRGGGKIFLE